MPFPISCSACGAAYRIPDALFATRFAGRATSVKCKRCSASIPVDGRSTTLAPVDSDAAVPSSSEFIPESVRPPDVEASPAPRAPSQRPSARPWVGLKSISLVPVTRSTLEAGSPSDPPAAPIAEPEVTPTGSPVAAAIAPTYTNDDLTPVVTHEVMRALANRDVERDSARPSPSDAPGAGASLRAVTLSSGPATDPPPSRPSGRRPPPLPTELSASVAPAQVAAVNARAAVSDRKGSDRVRLARWAALGIGGALATVWIAAGNEGQQTASVAAATPNVEPSQVIFEPAAEAPTSQETRDDVPAPAASASAHSPDALELAVQSALERAKECRPNTAPQAPEAPQAPQAPRATASLSVTFAPTGEAKSADIDGAPTADPAVEACILRHVNAVRVPAFAGGERTVRTELALD